MIRNFAHALVGLVFLLSMYAAVQDASETQADEWSQQ